MAGFGGLGSLVEPKTQQDLLDEDLPQLEEDLFRMVPQPQPEPDWPTRVIQNPGTLDTGVSSWQPEGMPQNNAYPELRWKVIQRPNEELGQGEEDVPDVPPRPSPEPIALRRYMTNGGVPFTMDEQAGPKMKAFLDDMEQIYPIDPKQSAAYNRRFIAGTNIPSPHGDLGGETPRAFDYNWTRNPRGGASEFDDARVRDILARHPDIEWGGNWRNPDRMHFEVRRSALGRPAAEQPRGGGKMDQEGIGALVDPAAQEGPQSTTVEKASGQRRMSDPDASAAPYSSWADYASVPQRNGIITAALHMMTGGYGLGSALGAGFEAYGNTSAAMAQQLANEQKMESTASEKAADRASHEKIAQTGADSRERVAEARIQAMLERTRMNLEAKVQNPSLALRYRTEARKIVEGNINNIQLGQSERELMVDQLAGQMYDADVARGRVPAGAGAGNSAGGSDYSGMGGGEAPAGKTGATAAEKKNPGRSLMQMAKDPEHGRTFIKDLETPEGQQKILSANPGLKAEIDNYNASNFHPLKMLKTYGF